MKNQATIKNVLNYATIVMALQLILVLTFIYADSKTQKEIIVLGKLDHGYISLNTQIMHNEWEIRQALTHSEIKEDRLNQLIELNNDMKELRYLVIDIADDMGPNQKTINKDEVVRLIEIKWQLTEDILKNKNYDINKKRAWNSISKTLLSYFNVYHSLIHNEVNKAERKQYILGLILYSLFAIVLVCNVLIFIIFRKFIIKPITDAFKLVKKGDYYQEKAHFIPTVSYELSLLFKTISVNALSNRHKNKELQRAIEEKGNFLSIVSHEMRTPLNVIVGNLQLFRNDFEYINTEVFNDIDRSSQSLLEIINNNLSLSKLERMGKDNKQLIDIKLITSQLSSAMRSEVEKKRLSVEFFFSKNLPLKIFIDQQKLNQVLINLVNNSIKASKNCGRIRIRFNSDKDSNLVISIFDNGIGMSSEQIPRLMRPFEQEDYNQEGNGLGTYITMKLIAIMSGRVSIKSKKGIGTLVTVKVPYKHTEVETFLSKIDTLPTAYDWYTSICLFKRDLCYKHNKTKPGEIRNILNSEYSNVTVSSSSLEYSDFSHLKVLLVEDYELNIKLFKRICEKLSLNLMITTSGKETLRVIEMEKFDMILMDIQLPDISGFEISNLIRKGNSINKTVKIIALSAFRKEDIENKCYESGMNYFLQKPFKIEELIKCISSDTSKVSVP